MIGFSALRLAGIGSPAGRSLVCFGQGICSFVTQITPFYPKRAHPALQIIDNHFSKIIHNLETSIKNLIKFFGSFMFGEIGKIPLL